MAAPQSSPKLRGLGSVKPVDPDDPTVWRVRVSAGRDPVTGKYKVIERIVRGSERQARRVAANLVTDVGRANLTQESCSLAALVDRVVTNKAARGRAPKTLAEYRRMATWLAAEYGKLEIRTLTPAWVDALCDRLIAEKGESSAAHYYRFLRTCLLQAVRWDLIERSPTDRVEGPSEPEPETEAPEPETVRALINAAEHGVEGKRAPDPDFAAAIFIAATTQLGPGELAGVQVRDVDFDRAQLSVRQSVSRVDGVKHRKATKTKARKAPVSIGPATSEVLRRQIEAVRERCQLHGVPFTRDHYLWSTETDHTQPVAPDWFSYRFRELREALGLDPIRFYDLRHYGATMALAGGADVKTVQGHLRHSTSRLTLDRYSHFVKASGLAAVQIIEATLTTGGEQ